MMSQTNTGGVAVAPAHHGHASSVKSARPRSDPFSTSINLRDADRQKVAHLCAALGGHASLVDVVMATPRAPGDGEGVWNPAGPMAVSITPAGWEDAASPCFHLCTLDAPHERLSVPISEFWSPACLAKPRQNAWWVHTATTGIGGIASPGRPNEPGGAEGIPAVALRLRFLSQAEYDDFVAQMHAAVLQMAEPGLQARLATFVGSRFPQKRQIALARQGLHCETGWNAAGQIAQLAVCDACGACFDPDPAESGEELGHEADGGAADRHGHAAHLDATGTCCPFVDADPTWRGLPARITAANQHRFAAPVARLWATRHHYLVSDGPLETEQLTPHLVNLFRFENGDDTGADGANGMHEEESDARWVREGPALVFVVATAPPRIVAFSLRGGGVPLINMAPPPLWGHLWRSGSVAMETPASRDDTAPRALHVPTIFLSTGGARGVVDPCPVPVPRLREASRSYDTGADEAALRAQTRAMPEAEPVAPFVSLSRMASLEQLSPADAASMDAPRQYSYRPRIVQETSHRMLALQFLDTEQRDAFQERVRKLVQGAVARRATEARHQTFAHASTGSHEQSEVAARLARDGFGYDASLQAVQCTFCGMTAPWAEAEQSSLAQAHRTHAEQRCQRIARSLPSWAPAPLLCPYVAES
ncbi:hypothetical protein CXG81DRAFT_26280 [Caulochytrium protostelioides]|uniref:Uncharacterized protein n=1 Tax=Caulochytrium protostelioides TaxID=1555241 RepID=A0A4P9X749_9FUNG|nr:hypothetical protein CXG81DRAFT_26280 [Caulochytrium protostelioides]|eukprot:RKP01028.1 hypothetical protein CXG81DRAFT_26280 [Caulochytrium protostelioides]